MHALERFCMQTVSDEKISLVISRLFAYLIIYYSVNVEQKHVFMRNLYDSEIMLTQIIYN